MGNYISKTLGRVFTHREIRILMLGLDGAGKTTILFRLKLLKRVETVSTVGFNVETINYRNVRFHIWDVGGQDKIRPLWRHYYTGSQAIIFVIDSSDSSRLEEAKVELHRLTSDREMTNAVVLIYANKQDLHDAKSVDELTDILRLKDLKLPHQVQPARAIEGKGLFDGLLWLSLNVKADYRKKSIEKNKDIL